ncbi:hypothetical protein MYP_2307 [Sporocytophaga myxococcoides]|uniref:Uncharacterized protein n=1 Tax=Sporocytophaga myxococcoides TaxID=153721 RepID=A0A098LF56_9BACT|nr:hypothetical protein [Sporocytophaga myxococcoides]GAL85079.1 hypothetical protein MYP_2307 [Sporocytophaga myxococcoides]
MDNNFYSQDKIDDFLSGKLSGTEKLMFEEHMTKDPLVSNELKLQEEIISHLKGQRKAELKARLDNINVTATSSYTSLKIAAGIVGTLLLSTTLYFTLFNKPADQSALIQQSADHPADIFSVEELSPQTESEVTTSETLAAAPTLEENKFEIKRELRITQLKKHPESVITETSEPHNFTNVSEPNFSDFESEDFNTESAVQPQKGDIQGSDAAKLDNISVKIAKKKNKDFHYQFFSNKLFLYGKFDEKPYEILELNSKGGRELYLKYEGSYFSLKSNQIDIVPLKEIHDKDITRELESLKK